MKKLMITLGAILCALPLLAQPRLTKDNIEEVLRAMTLEEKATLCVGGARSAVVEGVTSGQAVGPVHLLPDIANIVILMDYTPLPSKKHGQSHFSSSA